MKRTTAQRVFAVTIAAIMVFMAGCSSSDKGTGTAVSREEATRIVLNQVVAGGGGHGVVARMWNEPLSSGTVIGNEFAGPGEGKALNGSRWFFWIDDEPYAFYSHGVRYVYVNTATGAVEIEEAAEAPTRDGRLLWSVEALNDRSYIIFDNTNASVFLSNIQNGSSRPAPGGRAASMLAAIDSAGASDDFYAVSADDVNADKCCEGKGQRIGLILYNYDNGDLRKDISNNVNGMAAALANNSFTVPRFSSSTGSGDVQPAIYLGDPKGAGLQQLRDFVKEYSGPEHCCDEIVIYYTGHGSVTGSGENARYYFGTRFNYKGEAGNRSGQNRLYAEDLAQILSGLSSCHVQVIIDSCHSGGFREAIVGLKGVETFWPSCAGDELAYGGDVDGAKGGEIPDPYGRKDGENGSEYTSGFVKGLEDYADLVKKGAAPASASGLMEVGSNASWHRDIARIAGKTHPLGSRRLPGKCNCCNDTSTVPGGEDAGCTPGEAVQEVAERFAIPAENISCLPLDEGNTVLHSNGVDATTAAGATDMIGIAGAKCSLLETQHIKLFGSTDFPCGEGAYGLTLCPQGYVAKTGDYYLLSATFADDVPHADAKYSYQIGFVFDSDGDPANNYQSSSSWPADFFKDTDKWYVAQYAPGGGWTLVVSTAGGSKKVASGAHIIVNGDSVILVLPASEITPLQSTFRITAFRHDGSYGLNGGFWNADLSTAVGQPMIGLKY